MIIVEDTRNQIDKHKKINEDLEQLGIKVIRSKLYVGDYTLLNDQTICIDTKKDWLEVAGNICGKQHKRFREECLRAKNVGIKLIILVEESTPLEIWEAPKKRNGQQISQVNKETLQKAIITMEEKYNIQFINCSKYDTAETIINILGGE